MSNDQVNLNSVDAMFARLIAQQDGNHKAVMLRLDGQDTTLGRIEVQATKTNGRVTALEQNERDRKVRFATLAAVFSALGGGMVWAADKLFG